MSPLESKVLGTVNAPYGANLSACQLGLSITSISAAESAIGPVFSFFTEVPADQQKDFVDALHLDKAAVAAVANYLQAQCANPIALAG